MRKNLNKTIKLFSKGIQFFFIKLIFHKIKNLFSLTVDTSFKKSYYHGANTIRKEIFIT